MVDKIINVKFYSDIKIIKLNKQFDSFKLDLASILGINEEKLKLLNIFYKDEDDDNIFINTSEDYKQLLNQVQDNQAITLEVEVKLNNEKNNIYSENNSFNLNEKEFINENFKIQDNKKNFEMNDKNLVNFEKENNINQNNNEISFKVMCSLCKESNLKNVIFFCPKCKNYICSSCFEKIKFQHSHSFNIILTYEQFIDINENIFDVNENFNKNKEELSLVQKFYSNVKYNANNIMNGVASLFNKNNCNNRNSENEQKNNVNNYNFQISNNNNYQQFNNPNNLNNYNINSDNYQKNQNLNLFNDRKKEIEFIINQFRTTYELSKFTDKQLEEALEKADWDINKAIVNLF